MLPRPCGGSAGLRESQGLQPGRCFSLPQQFIRQSMSGTELRAGPLCAEAGTHTRPRRPDWLQANLFTYQVSLGRNRCKSYSTRSVLRGFQIGVKQEATPAVLGLALLCPLSLHPTPPNQDNLSLQLELRLFLQEGLLASFPCLPPPAGSWPHHSYPSGTSPYCK